MFGYYLASYLDFLGLQYITAALERLILFIYPTLVILLSAAFLGKPVTGRAVAALCLVIPGIGLAMVHDLRVAGEAGEVLLGCALVFGSALSHALLSDGKRRVVGRRKLAGDGLGEYRCVPFVHWAVSAHATARQPGAAVAGLWPVAGDGGVFDGVAGLDLVSRRSGGSARRAGNPAGTSGPVVTMLLGWLLLGESVASAGPRRDPGDCGRPGDEPQALMRPQSVRGSPTIRQVSAPCSQSSCLLTVSLYPLAA